MAMQNMAFASAFTENAALYRQSAGSDGVVGGVQVGYNWQRQPSGLVIGAAADFQGSGVDGNTTTTGSTPVFNFVNSATSEQNLNWFGTLRGRVGVPIGDRFMPFVSGGLAYGETDASANVALKGPRYH